jgi:uncharacterized protein (DUF427 family)
MDPGGPIMRATVNGTVVAESDDTVVVEGNHYFPPGSLRSELFVAAASELTTACPWKGTANYFDITVDGQTFDNVAWCYPEPKTEAAQIRDHVAFYPVVTVEA